MATKTKIEDNDIFASLGIEFTNSVDRETQEPIVYKRNKVIQGCELQIELFKTPDLKVMKTRYENVEGQKRRKAIEIEKQPKKWFQKSNGKYLCEVRYGAKRMEIRDGNRFAKVEGDKVVAFYEGFIQLVRTGMYDMQIMKLSAKGRT